MQVMSFLKRVDRLFSKNCQNWRNLETRLNNHPDVGGAHAGLDSGQLTTLFTYLLLFIISIIGSIALSVPMAAQVYSSDG